MLSLGNVVYWYNTLKLNVLRMWDEIRDYIKLLVCIGGAKSKKLEITERSGSKCALANAIIPIVLVCYTFWIGLTYHSKST